MALIFLKLFDGVEVRLAKFCRPYGFFKGLTCAHKHWDTTKYHRGMLHH